jgi:hypothetical protein
MKTGKIELLNKLKDGPVPFKCNFIEPGLISYEDVGAGVCLVTKEALDRFAPLYVGKPIVQRKNHKDDMGADKFDEIAVGIVSKVYLNDAGWYCAEGFIWNDAAIEDAKKGSVSCAYKVTESKAGGMHNNIKYDQEVVNGEPTHIAIVPNPRYEGARILLNSIEGGTMKFKAWFKKLIGADEKINAVDQEGSTVDVDGQKVPLKMLIDSWTAEETEVAEKKKLDDEAAAAATIDTPQELGEESTLTVDGKDVKLADMVNCYKKRNQKTNEAETPEEKAAREKKEKEENDKKNAEETPEEKAAREKKEKEDEDKKNAETPEAKKAREEKEAADKESAAKAEQEKKNSKESFITLKNRAAARQHTGPGPVVIEDKRTRGKELYGSKK